MLSDNSNSTSYSLKNDHFIMNMIPLVYTLHVIFLCLICLFSLVDKYFTQRYSSVLYIGVKFCEIIFFYLYDLYLQANQCLYLASAVHIIFDINIHYLFLEVVSIVGFNQEEFHFSLQNKERLKSKIIFSSILFSISYISHPHFVTVFSGLYMYVHGITVLIRCI